MSSAVVVARNHVQVRGRGPRALVFGHGFGCDQNMWRLVAPAFEPDFRVVLFDHVGSGRSDPRAYDPERHGTLHGFAADLVEICRCLGLDQVTYVGHSVGATIGLLASLQEPARFARLVLVGPSPCYVNRPPDYVGGAEEAEIEGLLAMMEANHVAWSQFFAARVMQNPAHPELTEELAESFCATDPDLALRFARTSFRADHRGDLPRVTVPALILQCQDDLIAPLEVGRYLHRHLPASSLRIMRATGHCPHLSHPAETTTLIRQYLESSSLDPVPRGREPSPGPAGDAAPVPALPGRD